MGGLGIFNPCAIATETYQFSGHVADPIVECILNWHSALPFHILNEQHSIFRDLTRAKLHTLTDTVKSDTVKSIYDQCPPDLQYIIDCLQERGSSSWLTSLPIKQYGFVLHKGDFIDALGLRYGWMPPRLPSHCVCSTDFSISHAFSCPHSAFPAIRHNNVRLHLRLRVVMMLRLNLFFNHLRVKLLDKKTADDACVDICAAGFWGTRHQHAFFDIRVFNSLAPSNRSSTLGSTYRKHEQEKRRTYEERICEVEHGYFTPSGFFYFWRYGQGCYCCLQTFGQPVVHKAKHPLPHSHGLAMMCFPCSGHLLCVFVALDRAPDTLDLLPPLT